VKVKRVGYVGVRTDKVAEMTGFFRDVLGLEAVGEQETMTFSRLPTGEFDFAEVFAEGHDDERLMPNGVDFQIAFIVDDVDEARRECEAAGTEILGDTVRGKNISWFFLRAPDGRVYIIEQAP
jgi:catechol 2,3-dioxygenase-like lactoylglutathione lyase family enzyme